MTAHVVSGDIRIDRDSVPPTQMSPITSGTMSLQEIADVFGIRLTKAYEMAAADSLPVPALKVGRTWRFSRQLVEGVLAGTYTRPVAS